MWESLKKNSSPASTIFNWFCDMKIMATIRIYQQRKKHVHPSLIIALRWRIVRKFETEKWLNWAGRLFMVGLWYMFMVPRVFDHSLYCKKRVCACLLGLKVLQGIFNTHRQRVRNFLVHTYPFESGIKTEGVSPYSVQCGPPRGPPVAAK